MAAQAVYYDDDNFYIQGEVCYGGELMERIDEVNFFTENKAAYISYQILFGINHMH